MCGICRVGAIVGAHSPARDDESGEPIRIQVVDAARDTAAVTALLDRLLHHAHVLKCGPRSWRTKVQTSLREHDPMR